MIEKATEFFGIKKIPTLSIWLYQEEFAKIEGLVVFFLNNVKLRQMQLFVFIKYFYNQIGDKLQ